MRYRIKEVITNGESWFYPQEKHFYLLWSGWTTTYSGYDSSDVVFSTKAEAEEFIGREIGRKKKSCNKVIIHKVSEEQYYEKATKR